MLLQEAVVPKLEGKLPPRGAALQGVCGRAHEDGHLGLRDPLHARLLEDPGVKLRPPRLLARAEEVVEGHEAVGLPPAEGSLDLDHGLAPLLPGEAAHHRPEEPDHPLGGIGLAEESERVAVLQGPTARQHIGQIGRKGGLVKPAPADVLVGQCHFSPRRKRHWPHSSFLPVFLTLGTLPRPFLGEHLLDLRVKSNTSRAEACMSSR